MNAANFFEQFMAKFLEVLQLRNISCSIKKINILFIHIIIFHLLHKGCNESSFCLLI